jgi:hypothetical protein
MNYKQIGAWLLIATATVGFRVSAREVAINFTDGSDATVVALNSVTSLTVSDDNLIVNLTAGDPVSVPISTISKITVNGSSSGLSAAIAVGDKLNVVVSSSVLTISGLDSPSRLSICAVNGQEVLSKVVTSGESVSVAELPTGVYVAKVDSTTVKFLKK